MESTALGQFVLPAMEEIPRRIPHLSAAVLRTPDGFNVCALGVDEQQVGKLAALSSSLLSIGDAAMSELRPDLGDRAMDLLTVQAGRFQVLGMAVRRPHRPLILMAAAEGTALGVMIVGLQLVARRLETLLDGKSS